MDATPFSRHLGLRNQDGRDYFAIRITTEGLADDHRGGFSVNVSTWLKSRRKILAISQCPGDFHQESIMAETGCYMASFYQNLPIGGPGMNLTCKLEADREYYINILYTDDELGTDPRDIQPSPDCVNSERPCGNLFNVRN